MSTFKARLQHTNRLSLAPSDFRALQDLIGTEKNVVGSMGRLSNDNRKAAEALKDWGLAEGDDLADVLGKLAGLFGHLSDAQNRFADHDATYRVHFKSVRMREENLASLKKSRDALGGKIQGLEKKVAKMSTENKDLPNVTERLKEARGEMVGLEHSVANEDARLSDFKRETVRNAMGLRLGAMLELAEKMTIISELGRLLIDEVPMETTEPGGTRAPYYGAEKTQSIVLEAQRCLGEVVFNPSGGAGGANAQTPNPAYDDGEHVADDSAYAGFDSRHQSVLPGQSGLPYAAAADSPRQGSPPPRLDFDPTPNTINLASPTKGAADYDPIRNAAQNQHRADDAPAPPGALEYVVTDSSAGGDAYWGRSNHGGPPAAAAGAIQPPPSATSTKAPEPPPTPPPAPRTPGGGGPAGRPPVVRGDSALGSRHGFDMGDADAYSSTSKPAAAAAAAGGPSGYSSARDGKRVNAGAFRKPQPVYASGPPPPMQVSGYQGPPPPTGPSPSETIKQQYMQRWGPGAVPPPGAGEEDGDTGTTAPLNFAKRRSGTPDTRSEEQHAPAPPYGREDGDGPPRSGFGQHPYVTNLE